MVDADFMALTGEMNSGLTESQIQNGGPEPPLMQSKIWIYQSPQARLM